MFPDLHDPLPSGARLDHVPAMRLHASCAALDGHGVLLTGAPGCGKSDLLIRLIDAGFDLVADDQVVVEGGVARAVTNLRGLIELRGLGIQHLPSVAAARIVLAVELDKSLSDRLPHPRHHAVLNVPLIRLDPAQPSAVARLRVALGCARGDLTQLAGAFAT